MESGQRGDLATLLEATRDAERTVFAAIDADERDRQPPDGGWSAKDIQVHITAWKRRQAERILATARGEVVEVLGNAEIDSINASEQAAHADWSWDAVTAEADAASRRLAGLARNPASAAAVDTVLSGILGNGSAHPVEHLAGIAPAGAAHDLVTGLDEHLTTLARGGGLPDDLAGVTLYNQACRLALAGRLDPARELLRIAFRLRPDLTAWARTDTDVEPLWAELDALAAE